MWGVLIYYMEKGGVINAIIFFVCFVIMYIGLGRFFLYRSIERGGMTLQAFSAGLKEHARPRQKNRLHVLDECIAAAGSVPGSPACCGVNRFREVLLSCVPELERGLDTMAAWIGVAPLLGLLGTVVGMIQTFTIIMQYGVGNPGLLSEGISVALLTTQAGLLVSFPALLFHNHLLNRKERLVGRLVAEGEKIVGVVKEKERTC